MKMFGRGIIKHLLVLFLISSYMISSCRSDDEEEDDSERPRSCQKYIYDFIMNILNSTLKCLSGQSTFKPNSIWEYSTRASCLLKCVLQNEGIVGENGRLDEIQAAFYFEENFDGPVKEITLPIAQGCFAAADKFNPQEYWCKSYLEFTECSFRAILAGLIPYGGNCITNPLLGILFSVLKYMAPDSPEMTEEMEELRRAVANRTQIKCMDKNCTKLYEYKKVNGSQSIVFYNKDLEVISVDNRKTKPKPKISDLKEKANSITYDNQSNYKNIYDYSNYTYNNNNNVNSRNRYSYS